MHHGNAVIQRLLWIIEPDGLPSIGFPPHISAKQAFHQRAFPAPFSTRSVPAAARRALSSLHARLLFYINHFQ